MALSMTNEGKLQVCGLQYYMLFDYKNIYQYYVSCVGTTQVSVLD